MRKFSRREHLNYSPGDPQDGPHGSFPRGRPPTRRGRGRARGVPYGRGRATRVQSQTIQMRVPADTNMSDLHDPLDKTQSLSRRRSVDMTNSDVMLQKFGTPLKSTKHRKSFLDLFKVSQTNTENRGSQSKKIGSTYISAEDFLDYEGEKEKSFSSKRQSIPSETETVEVKPKKLIRKDSVSEDLVEKESTEKAKRKKKSKKVDDTSMGNDSSVKEKKKRTDSIRKIKETSASISQESIKLVPDESIKDSVNSFEKSQETRRSTHSLKSMSKSTSSIGKIESYTPLTPDSRSNSRSRSLQRVGKRTKSTSKIDVLNYSDDEEQKLTYGHRSIPVSVLNHVINEPWQETLKRKSTEINNKDSLKTIPASDTKENGEVQNSINVVATLQASSSEEFSERSVKKKKKKSIKKSSNPKVVKGASEEKKDVNIGDEKLNNVEDIETSLHTDLNRTRSSSYRKATTEPSEGTNVTQKNKIEVSEQVDKPSNGSELRKKVLKRSSRRSTRSKLSTQNDSLAKKDIENTVTDGVTNDSQEQLNTEEKGSVKSFKSTKLTKHVKSNRLADFSSETDDSKQKTTFEPNSSSKTETSTDSEIYKDQSISSVNGSSEGNSIQHSKKLSPKKNLTPLNHSQEQLPNVGKNQREESMEDIIGDQPASKELNNITAVENQQQIYNSADGRRGRRFNNRQMDSLRGRRGQKRGTYTTGRMRRTGNQDVNVGRNISESHTHDGTDSFISHPINPRGGRGHRGRKFGPPPPGHQQPRGRGPRRGSQRFSRSYSLPGGQGRGINDRSIEENGQRDTDASLPKISDNDETPRRKKSIIQRIKEFFGIYKRSADSSSDEDTSDDSSDEDSDSSDSGSQRSLPDLEAKKKQLDMKEEKSAVRHRRTQSATDLRKKKKKINDLNTNVTNSPSKLEVSVFKNIFSLRDSFKSKNKSADGSSEDTGTNSEEESENTSLDKKDDSSGGSEVEDGTSESSEEDVDSSGSSEEDDVNTRSENIDNRPKSVSDENINKLRNVKSAVVQENTKLQSNQEGKTKLFRVSGKQLNNQQNVVSSGTGHEIVDERNSSEYNDGSSSNSEDEDTNSAESELQVLNDSKEGKSKNSVQKLWNRFTGNKKDEYSEEDSQYTSDESSDSGHSEKSCTDISEKNHPQVTNTPMLTKYTGDIGQSQSENWKMMNMGIYQPVKNLSGDESATISEELPSYDNNQRYNSSFESINHQSYDLQTMTTESRAMNHQLSDYSDDSQKVESPLKRTSAVPCLEYLSADEIEPIVPQYQVFRSEQFTAESVPLPMRQNSQMSMNQSFNRSNDNYHHDEVNSSVSDEKEIIPGHEDQQEFNSERFVYTDAKSVNLSNSKLYENYVQDMQTTNEVNVNSNFCGRETVSLDSSFENHSSLNKAQVQIQNNSDNTVKRMETLSINSSSEQEEYDPVLLSYRKKEDNPPNDIGYGNMKYKMRQNDNEDVVVLRNSNISVDLLNSSQITAANSRLQHMHQNHPKINESDYTEPEMQSPVLKRKSCPPESYNIFKPRPVEENEHKKLQRNNSEEHSREMFKQHENVGMEYLKIIQEHENNQTKSSDLKEFKEETNAALEFEPLEENGKDRNLVESTEVKISSKPEETIPQLSDMGVDSSSQMTGNKLPSTIAIPSPLENGLVVYKIIEDMSYENSEVKTGSLRSLMDGEKSIEDNYETRMNNKSTTISKMILVPARQTTRNNYKSGRSLSSERKREHARNESALTDREVYSRQSPVSSRNDSSYSLPNSKQELKSSSSSSNSSSGTKIVAAKMKSAPQRYKSPTQSSQYMFVEDTFTTSSPIPTNISTADDQFSDGGIKPYSVTNRSTSPCFKKSSEDESGEHSYLSDKEHMSPKSNKPAVTIFRIPSKPLVSKSVSSPNKPAVTITPLSRFKEMPNYQILPSDSAQPMTVNPVKSPQQITVKINPHSNVDKGVQVSLPVISNTEQQFEKRKPAEIIDSSTQKTALNTNKRELDDKQGDDKSKILMPKQQLHSKETKSDRREHNTKTTEIFNLKDYYSRPDTNKHETKKSAVEIKLKPFELASKNNNETSNGNSKPIATSVATKISDTQVNSLPSSVSFSGIKLNATYSPSYQRWISPTPYSSSLSSHTSVSHPDREHSSLSSVLLAKHFANLQSNSRSNPSYTQEARNTNSSCHSLDIQTRSLSEQVKDGQRSYSGQYLDGQRSSYGHSLGGQRNSSGQSLDGQRNFSGQSLDGQRNFSGQSLDGQRNFSGQSLDGQRNFSGQSLDGQRNFSGQSLDGQRNFSGQSLDGQRNFSGQSLDGQRNFSEQSLDGQRNFSGQSLDGQRNFSGQSLDGQRSFSGQSLVGDRKGSPLQLQNDEMGIYSRQFLDTYPDRIKRDEIESANKSLTKKVDISKRALHQSDSSSSPSPPPTPPLSPSYFSPNIREKKLRNEDKPIKSVMTKTVNIKKFTPEKVNIQTAYPSLPIIREGRIVTKPTVAPPPPPVNVTLLHQEEDLNSPPPLPDTSPPPLPDTSPPPLESSSFFSM